MLLLFIFSYYESYHKCSNNILQEPGYHQLLLTIGSITICLITLLLEISKKINTDKERTRMRIISITVYKLLSTENKMKKAHFGPGHIVYLLVGHILEYLII